MKIFQESGIMKHIRPNDLILADHGFTVQHLLEQSPAGRDKSSLISERKRESEYSRGVRNKENSQSQNPC